MVPTEYSCKALLIDVCSFSTSSLVRSSSTLRTSLSLRIVRGMSIAVGAKLCRSYGILNLVDEFEEKCYYNEKILLRRLSCGLSLKPV